MAISTVKAKINGVEYNLTLNQSTGKYEATITAPSKSSYNQTGHYYDVEVTATDTAGNSSTINASDAALGNSLKLKVKETVAPTIAVTSPSSGATITNNSPAITVQLRDNDSGINISTFSMTINGGSAITSTSNGVSAKQVQGGYDVTYTPPTALTDGKQTVVVNVKDNDGNAAPALTSTFTVDTTPPVLDVTEPANNMETNSRTVKVKGITNDATSSPVTVSITVNGTTTTKPTVNSNGTFEATVTCSNEGVNTIVITATDSAGKSTSITRTVNVDTDAPEFVNVSIAPNPVNTGGTYVISVTVE